MIPKYTAAGSCRPPLRARARNFVLAVVATMAVFLSPAVFAETSYYGGISISRVEYESGIYFNNGDVDGVKSDLTALGGRLGAQFHKNLSVELRLGLGLSGDSSDGRRTFTRTVATVTESIDTEYELKHYTGWYLRAGAPVGKWYPYLIAGSTDVEVGTKTDIVRTTVATLVTNGGVTEDTQVTNRKSAGEGNLSDFSYGVGTDIQLSDDMSANLEWMKYYDRGATEISAFQLGIVRWF